MSPKYDIVVSPRARKQIGKLPRSAQISLNKAIDRLVYVPKPRGYSKITGGSFRIRKGNYRIRG